MSLSNKFAKHTGLPRRDIELWTACGEAEGLADYLARGRRFADLSDENLPEFWKAVLHEYAEDPCDTFELALQDAVLELELRGIPAPVADVLPTWLKARGHFLKQVASYLASDDEGDLRREVLECVDKKKRAEN